MPRLKRHAYFVSIIAILFATGLSYTNAFRGQNSLLTPAVSADEEEDDRDEIDGEEDDSDDEKDDIKESDDEDNESDEDDDREERKVEYNRVRNTSTSTNRNIVGAQKIEEDDDRDNEGDSEGDNEDANDLQEKIGEINKDLSKIEYKIGILSANGVQVTYFTPVLTEVRALVGQAVEKISTAPNEAESILEVADHKLERLSKLVKVSFNDEDEDDDENDAAEKIQELSKDIVKIESKINLAAQSGVDVIALKVGLAEVKDLLNQAKDKMNAGDLASAETLAKMGDRKLESLEHSLEAIFEDEDEDDGEQYKSEVAQFVHNLKEIGEIEGGIGQQVNVVAQTQNDSAQKVETAMTDVDSRNGFTEFLVGPKYKSIAEIENAIKENQVSIKVLTNMAAQITDPAVRQVLQNQITLLSQQNASLQKFVDQSEDGFRMFGWLVQMFY